MKAVWTPDGVAFGFRMTSRRRPALAKHQGTGRLDGLVERQRELFLDVTGKNEGKFYQFIVNANCAVLDLKNSDATWNIEG